MVTAIHRALTTSAIVAAAAASHLAHSPGALSPPAGQRPTADYHGSAKHLLPSAAEAQYDRRTQPRSISQPSRGKRAGFENGWEATYRDISEPAPQASLTVYVYGTGKHANAAYRDACPTTAQCKPTQIQGLTAVQAKARTLVLPGGIRCVGLITSGNNLYVAVVTCAAGNYTFRELRFDAGYLARYVYGRTRSS